MPKIDTDDVDVKMQFLTVDEIRADDIKLNEKLSEWLDDAQAPVFVGDKQKVYLVIEISK